MLSTSPLPCHRVRSVVHPLGERHETVGGARKEPGSAGPPHLQIVPTALLAALSVANLTPILVFAVSQARSAPKRSVGTPLP